MISKFYLFSASVFPGAYRFMSIYIVTLFCGDDVANFFSESFFWIGLLVTFSGMAVSTQAYRLDVKIGLINQVFLVVVFIALLVPVMIFFGRESGGVEVILISAFFLSIFEVFRANLVAMQDYKVLFNSGCIAFVFLGLSVVAFGRDKELLVFFVFFSLALSVVFFMTREMLLGKEGEIGFSIFKDVLSYSFSNGFSTGLTFFVPILLIGEVGQAESKYIAQTVSITFVFLLYPKYLLTKFLGEYKKSKDFGLANAFERKVFLFGLVVVLLYLVVVNLYIIDVSKYQLLFVAIIASQLALPYSGVLMVHGKGYHLLRINSISIFMLFLSGVAIYLLFDKGEERALYFMFLYLIYILSRGVVTKSFTKKIAVAL